MNILVGTSSPVDKGSGINTYVKEIVAELRRREHDVLLVGPAPEDRGWLEKHGVEHLAVDQYSDPAQAAREILDALDRRDVDLVVNNDNPYVQSVAPASPCPFLSVVHLSYTSIASLATYNHRWVDHVVTISNEMRYRILGNYKVPARKVPLVYNGIVDPIVTVPARDHAGPLQVIFGGGSNRRKGFDLLFSAVKNYPDRWQGIELSIYGGVTASDKEKLAAYPFVSVRGKVPREQMLEALTSGHVFLFPSRREGCPMALIEAMAYGLVPIVSDGEGAMDVMVDSGVNGTVCRLADWETQMLDCLGLYAANRSLTDRHGQMARKEFVDRYQVGLTVQRLLELGETPTVDRTRRENTIETLRWHRPTNPRTGKAPLMDRLRIKLGKLRKHGSLAVG